MKTLLCSLLIVSALSFGQTKDQAVTVTFTIPGSTVDIVNSWLSTQCKATDAKGVCIQPQYVDLADYAKSVITAAITTAVQGAVDQALSAGKNLPVALDTAVKAKAAAQATIDAAKGAVVKDTAASTVAGK